MQDIYSELWKVTFNFFMTETKKCKHSVYTRFIRCQEVKIEFRGKNKNCEIKIAITFFFMPCEWVTIVNNNNNVVYKNRQTFVANKCSFKMFYAFYMLSSILFCYHYILYSLIFSCQFKHAVYTLYAVLWLIEMWRHISVV